MRQHVARVAASKLAGDVRAAPPKPVPQLPVSQSFGGPHRLAEIGVVQLRPAPMSVTGVTHLVALNAAGSLYDEDFTSNEVLEVSKPQTVVIETESLLRSRRGPNQEVGGNRAADKTGPQQYTWYEVLQAPGHVYPRRSVYIREGTFEVPSAENDVDEEDPVWKLVIGASSGVSDETKDAAAKIIHARMQATGATIHDFKITSSGGASLVIIPANEDVVYQVFNNDRPFLNIKDFHETGILGAQHSIHGRTPQYELRDYLADIRGIIDDYWCVVLEKVVPLNAMFSAQKLSDWNEDDELNEEEDAEYERETGRAQLQKETDLRAFVAANRKKIIWDINKAIAVLSQEFRHQDVSLDNIGIKNGKFVLFDFGGVKPRVVEDDDEQGSRTKAANTRDDLALLKTSLTSVLPQQQWLAAGTWDYDALLASIDGLTLQDKIDHLEGLTITGAKRQRPG